MTNMFTHLTFPRRIFGCLLSACLVWLSFPNFIEKSIDPWGAPLAWIALVPLFIALRGTSAKQSAWLGFVFGFSQLGSIVYWIAILEEAKYLGFWAWGALVLYLSIYFLIFGWLYTRSMEKLKLPGLWAAPFIWVALEYIRGSRPWGGFNWGEIGFTQASNPSLLFVTSFTGIYGMTFLIVWVNAAFSDGIYRLGDPLVDSSQKRLKMTSLKYFLLPILVMGAFWGIGKYEIESTVLTKTGTVVLLQPNIDQSVKWSRAFEKETYARYEKLLTASAPLRPDLILWPETGAPAYLLWDPKVLAMVSGMVKRTGTPQLVGCLDIENDKKGTIRYYNAAVHFDMSGKPKGVYRKRHLVPFGEFIPFQKYLKFLGPIVSNLGSFDSGNEYQKFQAKTFTYSPNICYEAVFSNDVRQSLANQADAIVNISNDAWYGHTAAAFQHALMEVTRSAEERRPLLRAANTGISLVTDPFGRIIQWSPFFTQEPLQGDVLIASNNQTFYFKYGNWLPRLCVLITFGLILILVWKRNKERIFARNNQLSDRIHSL